MENKKLAGELVKLAKELTSDDKMVEKFLRVKNGKSFFKIVFHLLDPMGNESTLLIAFTIKEGMDSNTILAKPIFYTSWSKSGTPESIHNLQAKGKFPLGSKKIEISDEETKELYELWSKNNLRILGFLSKAYGIKILSAIKKWINSGVRDIHNTKLKIAKGLTAASFDTPEEGEAFTNEISKAFKKKKRELGIKGIRQNYKGTGRQKAARQLYIKFKNGAVIDIWLYPDSVEYGGVVSVDPTGARTSPYPRVKKITNENAKKIADVISKDLKDWMDAAVAQKTATKRQAGTKITRIPNWNLESDVFILLIDELERTPSLVKKIMTKAWDIVLSGGARMAVKAITPLVKKLVDNNFEMVKEVALESDPFMQVDDPKFKKMVIKITAVGIIGELVEDPLRYKKFLSKYQQNEVEEIIQERGKAKFLTMLENNPKLLQGSKESADAVYQEQLNLSRKLLKSISSKLKKHSSQQKRDPKNWGYAGDLGYVVDNLKDIDSFVN